MRVLTLIIPFFISGCIYRTTNTVTFLDLSNKKLKAIPDSVFSLKHLEHLELGNSFTIYPPLSELGDESDPLTVDSMNKITEIPKAIEQLTHLRTLGLCFNDLKSLPKEFIKLKQLDTLDISFNVHLKIEAQSEILSKMLWLKYLDIIATSTDQASIEALHKALPNTKIVAKFEDWKIETSIH